MADDAPNGREIRDLLARIDERLKTVERQWGGVKAWLGTISAGIVVAIVVAYVRH